MSNGGDDGATRLKAALRAMLVLLATLAAAGCSSAAYERLVSEDSIPRLAALKALSAEQPVRTTLVPTKGPGGPVVSIAVHEVGDGRRPRTLVLLHGAFTDHTTWRFVAGLLARDYDLMLIDLPGCGESGKPDPSHESATVYAPEAVAWRVLEAVRECMRTRAVPPRLGIVGHSYGGLVMLRAYASSPVSAEFVDVLSRVDGMVMMSPVDSVTHSPDPRFASLAEASSMRIDLGLLIGEVRDRVANATLASTPKGVPALREEADKRMEILKDEGKRRGLQGLLSAAVPWVRSSPRRPDWDKMERIEAGYARVEPPTLIVWGRRDETLPISVGYKLAAQLPHATLRPVDHCMHSPQIECPEHCVTMITEFMEERSGALSGEPPGP